MQQDESILKRPLAELDFSSDFKVRSQEMGFDTLGAVVHLPPAELIRKRGFNYGWLGELSAFMQKNKLLHLLQPMPGNIAG